jgi:antitoxin ChpS
MPTATLRNVGGSVVLAVPKKILSLVDLHAGAKVKIAVEKGRVIIEPDKKPRYTLAELLRQTKRSDLKPRKRDRAWLRGTRVGSEEI